jgi:hypothetical protein
MTTDVTSESGAILYGTVQQRKTVLARDPLNAEQGKIKDALSDARKIAARPRQQTPKATARDPIQNNRFTRQQGAIAQADEGASMARDGHPQDPT